MAENPASDQEGQDSPYEWLAKKLAPFAGVLALGYVYAYILGYAYLWRFYATLGAPWALDLLDFTTIARTPTIGAVLLLIASSVFVSPWIRVPDIKLSGVLIAFASTLTIFLIDFFNSKLTKPNDLHLDFLVEISLVISIFCWFCNSAHRSIEKFGERRSAAFMTSIFGVGIFLVTPIFAENSAEKIRRTGGKYLPRIATKDNDEKPSWRLIRHFNPESLLALRLSDGGALQFKIIESAAVESISQPDRANWTETKEVGPP